MMRLKLLLFLPVLALLQGCDMVKALGAMGYGLGVVALNARPDKNMEFEVEVAVNDGKVLLFKGETRCEHEATLLGGRYKAQNDSASLKLNGRQWILEGLTCDSVGRVDLVAAYNLYEVVDEKTAKVYYVTPGGSAEVKKNTLRWGSYFGSSSSTPLRKYSVGPFVYQKIYLKEIPPFMQSLAEPALVFSHTNQCSRMPGNNQPSVRASPEELAQFTQNVDNVRAIEEGFLHYNALEDSWSAPPDNDSSRHLDVSFKAGWDNPQIDVWATCFRVAVPDGSAIFHKFGAANHWVYIPKEKAILRAALLSHGEFSAYRSGDKSRVRWL